ncbi:Slp family lipoprotein [Methylacidimicrobium sp. B4]|uniref:Slp family lipoprotein n=1 Tax=Methylacidimicrobium sp. B4 TaxID=2796139 RepID=UPI001A903B45|nr:Slp family lipoprotein [Methylacidimicrobium sp. B4]QSR84659.1 Slp family lipoprotein [Methylacidimicrobium sp. B4]
MRRTGGRKREGLASLALLLLLGCSPVPEPVRIAAESQGSFASIRRHPEADRGKPALLGGRIVRVVNLGGRTRIEIDRLPLDDQDRPRSDARGEGHFLAEIPEKIDPSAYPWGRLATVWGVFAGAAEGRPLVTATKVYLWPRRYGKEPLYSPAPYQEGNVGAGWDPGWWW